MDTTIAIVSDLHLGEGVLDDFDEELEAHFIEFLQWLGDVPGPVELVINGDFLDFAQATPWRGSGLESETLDRVPLCFTEQQSVLKFNAIRKAHQATFNALWHFLEVEKHRIVLLPGNHDADFFWPRVRQLFVEEVLRALLTG